MKGNRGTVTVGESGVPETSDDKEDNRGGTVDCGGVGTQYVKTVLLKGATERFRHYTGVVLRIVR